MSRLSEARGLGWFILTGLLVLLFSHVPDAGAHEIRPAYLQIDEIGLHRYNVMWRTPLLSGMRLPVVLRFPADVRNVTEPTERTLPDSVVERRVIEATEGLAGKRIEFTGLEATITDVLVRVKTQDGRYSTTLVHPSQPWVAIGTSEGTLAVAGAYLMHGIDHILFGFDHLIFVFALILIVPNRRVLLWTITAFTIAHSITLSLAALGFAHVPGPPVEASIALSILLLAGEIVRLGRGQQSLTARWPWVVAFAFGLLHGFGFAGALIDLGLPSGDVPLALFTFNVGVELGQLVFIFAVLAVLRLAKLVEIPVVIRRAALPVATYAIGTMAASWFFERLTGFAGS